MKKLAIFVSMLLGASTFAQSVYDKSEVVEIANTPSATLSTRAVEYLKSKKFDPKQVGPTINGMGAFTVTYPSVKRGMQETGKVVFKIAITVKDNKYRIVLSNFMHEGIKGQATGGSLDAEKPVCGETQISNLAWSKIKEQAKGMTESFIPEIKANMDAVKPKADKKAETDF